MFYHADDAKVAKLVQLAREETCGHFSSEIMERLSNNPGDRIASALKMLKAFEAPISTLVIFRTAQAAEFAISPQPAVQHSRQKAEQCREIAERTEQLAFEIKLFAPMAFHRALAGLSSYMREQSEFYKTIPDKLNYSQNRASENAVAILMLRRLRAMLFGGIGEKFPVFGNKSRAPHDPLVNLAAGALGIGIDKNENNQWPGWVKDALRQVR